MKMFALKQLLAFPIMSFFLCGCVPPDWSVCDCQWLDNHWFHHISVLHEFTGEQFLANLLTPGTRLHAWVMSQTCPEQVWAFGHSSSQVLSGSNISVQCGGQVVFIRPRGGD